jgi:hypothetical protein
MKLKIDLFFLTLLAGAFFYLSMQFIRAYPRIAEKARNHNHSICLANRSGI